MHAVITGTAGFIGSRLARRCAGLGWTVVGLDCLRPYYDLDQKRRNLCDVEAGGVEVRDVDLAVDVLEEHLGGADVVFHLAGQPGVRASWDEGFGDYCRDNILATQRLLDAAVRAGVPRVVYASSSSVYGDADTYPVTETALPRPISPYGVSKLAAEHLCLAYAARGAIEVVALRYFTVYGPGQRPDMAIHRLILSALSGAPFTMFGSGQQMRDFTFVVDVVEADVLAATAAELGGAAVANVAGGSQVRLVDVIALVGAATGRPVNVVRTDVQAGDVRRTGGSVETAARLLGWTPSVPFEAGIRRQVAWHQQLARVSA
jgi:UDP-glucuronate 4-epimerase